MQKILNGDNVSKPIIAVANQKGGVGKTTTAIHVACGIKKKDKKSQILVIDLDPQKNTTLFFSKEENLEVRLSSFELFIDKLSINSSLTNKYYFNSELNSISFIPASLNLVKIESILKDEKHGFYRIKNNIKSLVNDYDYIIFDCPPSLSIITINALIASNYVLIPLQASEFSLNAIESIYNTIDIIQNQYQSPFYHIGALLVMFQSRATISKVIKQELIKRCKEKGIYIFNTNIPYSIIVEEAHLIKQSLYEYSKYSIISKKYLKLCDEMLNNFFKKNA